MSVPNNKIYYYNDKVAHLDTEQCPESRDGERCINCNKWWDDHLGWKCGRDLDPCGDPVSFYYASSSERYLTPSMQLSIRSSLKGKYAYLYDAKGKLLTLSDVRVNAPVNPTVPEKLDMSDWRTWAKVPAGYCACNRPKEGCAYHDPNFQPRKR